MLYYLKRIIFYAILVIIFCLCSISIAGNTLLYYWDLQNNTIAADKGIDKAVKKLMRYHGVDMIKIVEGKFFYIWRDNRWIKVKAR